MESALRWQSSRLKASAFCMPSQRRPVQRSSVNLEYGRQDSNLHRHLGAGKLAKVVCPVASKATAYANSATPALLNYISLFYAGSCAKICMHLHRRFHAYVTLVHRPECCYHSGLSIPPSSLSVFLPPRSHGCLGSTSSPFLRLKIE